MVGVMFLLSFLLGTSFNFLETAAFTLFLGPFSSKTLPWIYIINAFVVSGITFGYLRLGSRLRFSQQLAANLTLLLLLLVGFRIGLAVTTGPWVAFALPVLFQIVVSLGNIAYWTLAGRVVNVRQAKRLFGLLGAGMWVAIVVTGFLIPFIVRAIGTPNLLVLSVVAMAAALGLLILITRSYATQVNRTGEHHEDVEPAPISSLLRNRFILLMFSLSVFAWISFFFVDNMFYNRVGARFPDEQQLASFLGLYLAFLGILTLLNNSFLTAPVIGRFGVRGGLLVLPGALLVGALLFTVTGTVAGIVPVLFWLATMNKMLDLSLGFSVDQAGQTILYQPLPARERSRVQTMDEGMVRMLAVGVAGVLLLLLNQVLGATVVELGYVLLVVVLVWIGAVVMTGREYPQALRQALIRRHLTGANLTIGDPASIEALKQALHDPNPQVALSALTMLEGAGDKYSPTSLETLLAHPAAEVRIEAVRRLCRQHGPGARTLVLKTLDEDASADVRAAALEGLAQLGEADSDAVLMAHLRDPEPALRRAAIAGLLQHGSPAAHLAACTALSAMATSALVEQRLEACQVIAEAASPDLEPTLARLLDDGETDVRRQALLTVAGGAFGGLWPKVAACLNESGLRGAATGALAGGGGEALPAIARALDNPELSSAARQRLLRACGRIGSPEAALLALRYASADDDPVRTESARALERCAFRAGETTLERLHALVRGEVAEATTLLAARLSLAASAKRTGSDGGSPQAGLDDNASQLLAAALNGQLDRGRERVLLLLACLYDRATLRQVADNLAMSHEQRAYAIEVLDVTVGGDLKPAVLPLFEDLPDDARHHRLHTIFPQPAQTPAQHVLALVKGEVPPYNRWTQACAVAAAAPMGAGADEMAAAVAAGLHRSAADPVVGEVAARALASMDPAVRTRYDLDLAKLQELAAGKSGFESIPRGGIPMLSPLEKVLVLRSAELFKGTPDDILVEVAGLLEEVHVGTGEMVFAKGDKGESMYLIVGGEVRVHDGPYTINYLHHGDIFGEMALLDSEPRMASITATTETQLLRLDQDPFYELLEDRPEVARGVIHVLSIRLRATVAGRKPASQAEAPAEAAQEAPRS